MDKIGKDTRKITVKKYGFLGKILFLAGSVLSGYLFFLIQILNSYPFWDYINGYRLQLKPFTAVYGDITYLPWPIQFLKYTQLFDIGVASAFTGLFIWKLSSFGKVSRRAVLSASGFTLLVTGTICAVIVYLQINVLTEKNLPWGAYAWGTERVAYNTQFMGAEYNCSFLNYSQLLYISVSMVIIGFILWSHFSVAKLKAPSTLAILSLFVASFALLISGLFLLFPAAKFTSPDPSIPATPYAIQGTMLVWTGAILLMFCIINFCEKLKLTIDYAVNYFKNKGNLNAKKKRPSIKTLADV